VATGRPSERPGRARLAPLGAGDGDAAAATGIPTGIGVSVVMPVYNERDNVEPAVREVLGVLDALDRPGELIVVDDGSSDGTAEVLAGLHSETTPLRVVRLRRNFGQTAALSAGIERARGGSIVLIDGDQQNDPADIPRLLDALARGYDVVSGWRADRKDALLLRRIPSHCANALISRVTGVALHDYGCTLKAYDAALLSSLRLYGDQHRFIPALASMSGARVLELPVNHRPRTRGSSKYGISRLPRVLADLLTVKFLLRYRTRPMHLFAKAALCCGAAAAASSLRHALERLVRPAPSGRAHSGPRAVPAVMLASAVQLLGLGLLAELLVRVYHEATGRSSYVVAATSGFDEQDTEPASGRPAGVPPLPARHQPHPDMSPVADGASADLTSGRAGSPVRGANGSHTGAHAHH
jgi:glycosyltransferase involved in cell wall biosynthesis